MEKLGESAGEKSFAASKGFFFFILVFSRYSFLDFKTSSEIIEEVVFNMEKRMLLVGLCLRVCLFHVNKIIFFEGGVILKQKRPYLIFNNTNTKNLEVNKEKMFW